MVGLGFISSPKVTSFSADPLPLCAMSHLSLSVPRVRSGQFRPFILPPLYLRTRVSFTNLLDALTKRGFSDAAMEEFFKSIKLPYSHTEINKINNYLSQTQQLPSEFFAAFIDAYNSLSNENKRQG